MTTPPREAPPVQEVRVTSPEQLRAIVGEPAERARRKVRPHLDELDRGFLAASRLCFVATVDTEGRADVSPKGDPAGYLVRVLDEHTIALADRPGNKRIDGHLNLLQDPRIGVVFLVPGRADTLRVNGTARIVSDAPWFDDLAVRGTRPALATVIDIDEVFGHCGKSLIRAQAWHPETWTPDAAPDVSSTARERRARGERTSLEGTVVQIEAQQMQTYGDTLY